MIPLRESTSSEHDLRYVETSGHRMESQATHSECKYGSQILSCLEREREIGGLITTVVSLGFANYLSTFNELSDLFFVGIFSVDVVVFFRVNFNDEALDSECIKERGQEREREEQTKQKQERTRRRELG